MNIRPRVDADLRQCDTLIRRVHARDGYPPFLGADDFLEFLVRPDSLAAWVADGQHGLAGHVALHPRGSDAVMAAACEALGLASERLGVVARLLVDEGARGSGLGRALLATATSEARTRGLVPVLDVVTSFGPAIALYESCGWTRLGRVTVSLPDGTDLDEFVYVAPGVTAAATP